MKKLKNIWYVNMRKKFVSINLKIAQYKYVLQEQETFYRYLIFLEEFISHKGDIKPYKTQGSKEIIIEIYDELTGTTYTIYSDSDPELIEN